MENSDIYPEKKICNTKGRNPWQRKTKKYPCLQLKVENIKKAILEYGICYKNPIILKAKFPTIELYIKKMFIIKAQSIPLKTTTSF